MRVPVVLLTGVHPEALATAMVGLQFDLPHAVAVRHHLDPEQQVLTRVVSDVTGVVEHERIDLDHACVSCALREDVLPTLERVARDPRWRTVIAHLPVGALAAQVCAALARDTRLARYLRIASVVTPLAGPGLVDDLLGDTLLADRSLHSSAEDRRGLGETAAQMIEYADVVAIEGNAEEEARDLVRRLTRPGVAVLDASADLDPRAITGQLHRHDVTRAWVDPVRAGSLVARSSSYGWSVELASPRPFHPQRLLEGLDALGGGRHRSRGCFWLPTRPGQALVWDGAGGQLSVGDGGTWAGHEPRTRLLLTGVGAQPAHLESAFERLLVTDAELDAADAWRLAYDGFEPWLGTISEAA